LNVTYVYIYLFSCFKDRADSTSGWTYCC